MALSINTPPALFSPHTSWDSVPGGINSWLLEPYGPGQATPVTPATSKSYPGGHSHSVSLTGVAVSTEQLQVSRRQGLWETLPPVPPSPCSRCPTSL